MANSLPEEIKWENTIYQLEKDTPVLGGTGGPDNIQAQQLANRTQYLKSAMESIPDYREYTFYPTSEDPDGTIAGLAATADSQSFRVAIPDAVGQVVAFNYYVNNNGIASFINSEPSTRSINEIKSLIGSTDTASDIYLSVVDDNGFGGDLFHCKLSDASFGTLLNRISNNGIQTETLNIAFEDIDGMASIPLVIIDKNGFGIVPSGNSGSGDVGVSNTVISGSMKAENGLVDLWSFANKQSMRLGKKSSTVLTFTGSPVEWPYNITLQGGSSWITLPYTESPLYTLKVVFQLPYIAKADYSTARGVVYSFDDANNLGTRIHLQTDSAGRYILYAFKLETGFPVAGLVLPPEFTAGDWLCLHHVVSRANTGDNYQCMFLGNRYAKWVEADYTTLTPSLAQLNIGATAVSYSSGYNYAYCDLNVAECAYYNSALNERALRNSFASTKNRMSNIGITLKGF